MNNLNKISLSPGKQVSAGAIIGLIFLLIFGIAFTVLVGEVLVENDASILMSIVFYVFMFGWIGTAVFMIIYHTKNLKNAKGLSVIDINTDTDPNTENLPGSPIQRLRDLESMKKEGLISEKEYEQKRTQMMGEKW
jgi:hypothetical protein